MIPRRLAPVAFALPLALGTCTSMSEPARVATTIDVLPTTVSLAAIGATRQITAAVRDQTGNTLATASVTWTTSNAAVVTVSATGLATAVANGSAEVMASSGSAAASVTVTVAQAAAQLVSVSGDSQTAVVGQALAQPVVVRVNDATGHAVAGASVSFAAAAGSGTVGTASATTNASGQAQSTWTLGPTVGHQTVTAIVGALDALPFTATATPAGGGSVVAYMGNNQMGLVGYPVNVRPAVRVTDASTNPVPGATVTFAVASGGGTLTGATTTTNTNGIAQVASWTLGGAPARNTTTATVTGAGVTGNPVTFSDTGAAAVYAIDIQYFGPAPNSTQRAAFTAAVTRWQSIIYQHVGAPILFTDTGNQCGAGEPAVSQTVNDILILAKFDSIDGAGKILAQAGPCFIRGNGLTVMGIMIFDTADVANLVNNGLLNTVILHEMSHVLGFGTLWNVAPNACMLLSSNPPGMIQDTYFSCPKARAAFDSLGGTHYTGGGSSPPAGNKVPVENCGTSPYVSPACGSGTVNSHWREVVLVNELMTGYINNGSNPLSVVSIAAQEDLGYTVNYAGADAYSHAFTAPPLVAGAPPVVLDNDVRHGPIFVVDASGTVVRVISR